MAGTVKTTIYIPVLMFACCSPAESLCAKKRRSLTDHCLNAVIKKYNEQSSAKGPTESIGKTYVNNN